VEIVTLGRDYRIYYVHNFSDVIEEATATYLDTLNFNNLTVYPLDLTDVDNDGDRLLIQVVTGENDYRLFAWNIQDTSQSQLIPQSSEGIIVEAAFSPRDETNIWYIDQSDIVEYSLRRDVSTILNTTVNSIWVDRAWFSPDGAHVALLERDDSQSSLYVVEVQDGD
jgi:hypothetical protein